MICSWYPAGETLYMPYVYPRDERADLTLAEVRILRRLVEEEFK